MSARAPGDVRAQRVLLLIPSTSYRVRDFLAAAARLEVAVTVGSDHAPVLGAHDDGAHLLRVDFDPVGEGVAQVLAFARAHPLHAVIGTDERGGVLAAAAAKALGLRHNDPDAVRIAGDKHRMRQAMASAGLPVPWFELLDLAGELHARARTLRYPCVLKPLHLCASQGVMRVDDAGQAVAAARRIARIVAGTSGCGDDVRARRYLLAEGFIPGREVALEGLLDDGVLTTLALFDKPDPLDGPFFEESVYVAPSTLREDLQRELARQVQQVARAMGLRHGPVHAEARVHGDSVYLVEIAARSIGGLCSRTLRFAPDVSLEELILRHALGLPRHNYMRDADASGVMMIPVPRAGRLAGVDGVAAACAVPGIEDVVISMAPGDALVPLPEGGRYLGFIFARGARRLDVERALREAHGCLRVRAAQAPQ